MTHPLTSQRKVMDIILAFIMITSFPSTVLGVRNYRTHQSDQNSINSISKTEGGHFDTLGVASDWVKISSGLPSSVIVKTGETLILECEVYGSPPPDVKWLKDGKVLYPSKQQDVGNYAMQGLYDGNDIEEAIGNNLSGEADVLRRLTGGLVKVRSRLQISCVTPKHQGVYTCLATVPTSLKASNRPDGQYGNFPQTALTSTIVNVPEVRKTKMCPNALQGRFRQEGAWIQEWSPIVMQKIGKGVVINCLAEGNPKPTITWLNSSEEAVPIGDAYNSRLRVLPTGELFIKELLWDDMGGYTCMAHNSIGKASETTFLYPARESEDQS